MSQFTIYSSTDTGAPTLTGTVGSLTALLDACLVNGYGSKAAAGWTQAYTGTNKAAYRMGTGVQAYLRVQDDAGGTGVGRDARITAYQAMTSVDAGVNPFPSVSQPVLTGLTAAILRKSTTADSVDRPWFLFADSKTFYLFTFPVGTTSSTNESMSMCGFGSFLSTKTPQDADLGNCMLWTPSVITESASAYSNQPVFRCSPAVASTSGGVPVIPTVIQYGAQFVMSGVSGFGPATLVNRVVSGVGSPFYVSTSPYLGGHLQCPNGPDGAIYLGPIWLSEYPAMNLRGRLRGVWNFQHPPTSLGNLGDIFTGSGPLAGRSFFTIRGPNTADAGICAIEISDTLDTF